MGFRDEADGSESAPVLMKTMNCQRSEYDLLQESLPLRLMRTIPASRTSISIVRMYKTSITNNRNFYLAATDKNQNSKPPQKSQLFRKTVNALARFFEKFPQLPPGQWREKQSIKSPYPERDVPASSHLDTLTSLPTSMIDFTTSSDIKQIAR
ncbi:unnamed protein product [Nesidiocoris tenuis]|uniref:Uncharacterized protein n=1 Tax=Nesidiocoris tenuis TaxID=355587 RepID=A0A6H5HMH1_9HEMI|nr:unnamed protein product [Nesidiocoris tenuis]